MALHQNAFDMIWDSGKAWTDGIFLIASATSLPAAGADNVPKIKLVNCLRAEFEIRNPTAWGPLVLNPLKDPPLLRIVDDCAIAVGFTLRTETTRRTMYG